MRALVFAAALSLAACVSAPGAQTSSTPFITPAAAAPAAGASYPIAVDLPAGEYRNDPRHGSVTWRIRHEGLAWFTARFDTVQATLTLDPTDPSRSSLQASIDATSDRI